MQEKEDKKGFLQSFTGKFKKISLDDEPDELMLKYGDIKLKGPGGGEGQSGIHAARTSFFFSENRDGQSPKAGDRPEIGMTQEISGILDAIKQGRGPSSQQNKPKAAEDTGKKQAAQELKPIGVTQEVNGILEALGRSNKISQPEQPEEPVRAQTWTPKKEEFSQAFEKIKNEKENASQPENPQFGTQEIARIISEVTGERAETIRPVELIPEKEEQPAPIPQEELPGQLPPENESGLPEEAEYEEGLEEPDGGEEYGQEPEDEQKPKLGFGRRLKAFFKNLVTLPEAQQGEDPFAEDDWEEARIPEEVPAQEAVWADDEEEDFSIRPELFFQDDQEEASRKQPERPNGRKTDADSRKELETGRLEQTAPEEEAKKEAPMEPAADAGDGWEESEGSEEKADEASADSKPQEAAGQEDHGQGEAPEASGPEAGGQEQQDEQAPPVENPLADGGEKEIAAEAPEKAEKDPEKAVESEQAHAPQQAEQEAETPQDKIEAEEGGEAQNQQDQEKTEAVSREKPVSRYEKAFGKVKPAPTQKNRVIRIDPETVKPLTAREAARLYCEHRELPAVDLGGLAIGELLQEENQTAAQVTVLSGGRDRAQATGPKAAERQVNEKPRRENKPDKPSVQAVTINLADLQAGKKIRHHENTKLFHYEPQLPVVHTAAGKFGENLRAECAVSRQAIQHKAQQERKQNLEREEAEEAFEPVKKKRTKEKVKKRHFAIFSSQEEEDPEDVMPQPRQVELVEDYKEPSDAFAIKKEIFKNLKNLLIRTGVLAGLMILSAAATVLARLNLPDVPDVLITNSPLYLSVTLVLLLAAGAVSLTTLKNGFLSVPRLKGNADAPVAFAWAAAVVQILVGFFSADRFTNTDLSLYANLAVLALLLNAWGKLTLVRRVKLNFKFICSPDEKYAAKIYNDRESAVEMCRGLGVGEPIIAYQKKAGFLSNFLQLSYEPDPSEEFAGRISFLGAGLSLALGVVSYFISRDLFAAVSAFALSMCVCVPMCTMLTMNFPVFRLCKRVSKLDAMIVGYPGIRQFADTNAVVLDCNTLFPKNAVVLHGVKAFETRLLDKALLEAAAMLKSVDSPLYHVFEQIVSEERRLPAVDSLSYEDERGLMGWVHGKRVLVGNRNLLENHGVTPPDRSVELEHTQNGRQVTYIASAGELVAMLITNYDFSPAMKQELQRLEDNGVSFLVSTTDPNVTAKLVSDRFGLFFRSVKVLGAEYAKRFKDLEGEEEASARAYLATQGRVNVLARVLAACVRVRGNMTAALVLQRLTVLLSFLMAAFLTVVSGVAQIGALEITLYSIFWVVVTLLVTVIRKP